MRTLGISLILSLLLVAGVARGGEVCGATVTVMSAYQSAWDQQQHLSRAALELGPAAVQTAVAHGVSARYLVVETLCDVFVSLPETTPKMRAVRHSVFIPEDHPFEWITTSSISEAVAEHARQEPAKSRGVLSLGDGTFLVYWSKEQR